MDTTNLESYKEVCLLAQKIELKLKYVWDTKNRRWVSWENYDLASGAVGRIRKSPLQRNAPRKI